MTSFVLQLEPAGAPRLAAAVLLYHALAAAMPWFARVPASLATVLSLAAVGGLVLSVMQLPGPHCRLAGVRHDGRGWGVRLAGAEDWLPAELSPASRTYPWLVCLMLRTGRRQAGWLLAPGSVPAADFRRLKARIRLAC
jgi:hypothetical protein